MKGKVHSFETFGAADGPGVRFVAFLYGCPFRCRYCHNPDTWAGGKFEEIEAEEVLAKALRYRAYWGGGGGITLSGGEPMAQPKFAAELFEKAHEAGVTTCLDTAAGPFRRDDESVLRLLEATDTVLLDIKHLDPAAHRSLTGADNAPVLDCARYLAQLGKDVWIRHVLVPGITDDPGHLRALKEFAASLGNVKRTEILPYHSFGEAKWEMLGLDYPLAGVPPAPDSVRTILDRL